jgi:hypothetical protein
MWYESLHKNLLNAATSLVMSYSFLVVDITLKVVTIFLFSSFTSGKEINEIQERMNSDLYIVSNWL